MRYETLLFLAFTLLIVQEDLLGVAQVVKCEMKGNYSSNSAYSANLNTIFSSLYTNVDNNGFYSASGGQGLDRANGIVLCAADANLTACRGCVQAGPANLLSSCPNQKGAIRWADACMLRYSNETLYGKVASEPNQYWWNPTDAVSPELFMNFTNTLVDDLRNRAVSGGPLRKVAARDVMGPALQHIYAMVQCTPDLSPQDCHKCLTDATAELNEVCDRKRGCQILWPTCNIRYETYPFFNESRLREFEHIPAQPSPGKEEDNKTRIIISVVAPIVVCLILAASATAIVTLRKKRNKKSIEDPVIVDQIEAAESVQYAFSRIKAATNDFSDHNKLGQGGFGTVYKGKLENDQEIAVKRLSIDSQQGDLEFKNEVLLLAKLQHRNLVRLLGFALQGMEKLLVYEFVQNASLDLFIFDPIHHLYLDWERRYKIIVGIARGILYLHEDSRLRIIHRDLKASNILLHKDMNPKIADFGMAKLFGQDETRGSTSRIVGTYGYMPPEYIMHGQFSIKSDVFSFGVLVLEIISGRRNSSAQSGENVEVLLSYAWKNWRDGTIENMVDPLLRSNSGSMSEMVRCIHIGLLCVQQNAADRPTMASVVLMLSSFSMTLVLPSAPAFNFPNSSASDASCFHDHNNSRNAREYNDARAPADYDHSSGQARHQSDYSSQNEASISELYPR